MHRSATTAPAFLLLFLLFGLPPAALADAPASAEAVRVLIDSGRYDDAEVSARSLLAEAEKDSGAESLAAAHAIDLVVESMRKGDKTRDPETRSLAGRSVAIKEAALGPEHLDLAASLTTLGSLLRVSGDPRAARPLLERAVAIEEKTLGPDHPDLAGSLTALGNACMDLGDMPGATKHLERALEIRRKVLPPDHPDIATTLSSLGAVVRNRGEYARARDLHEQCLAIRRRVLPPNDPELAVSLQNIAEACHRMGDLACARTNYDEALKIEETAAHVDPYRHSEALTNLADLYRDTGDYAEARRLYERAISMREQRLGPNHLGTGLVHNAFGELLKITGDSAGARTHFERAVSIWQTTLGPKHPLVAVGMLNLADLLRDLGDYATARPLYDKALASWEHSPYPNHPYAAQVMHGLANLLQVSGDAAAARPLYDKALEIEIGALGPEHPVVGETMIDRARLRWSSGDPRGALDGALQGETIVRKNLRDSARSLSEAELLRYEGIRRSGLELALSILASGDPAVPASDSVVAVLDQIVRSRALVLDLVAERHRTILEHETPEIRALMLSLENARNSLARLIVNGPEPQSAGSYRTALESSREARDAAERAVAEKSLRFRSEQQGQDVGFDKVAASLPEDAALVAYVAYAQHRPGAGADRGVPSYAALVVRGSTRRPAFVALGPADRIEGAIVRWGSEVAAPPKDLHAMTAYTQAGDALRQAVWDPLAGYFQGARKVFLVPDGALHLVSFATLPLGKGSYLVESGPTLQYLSAERDVASPAWTIRSGDGLLVVGGPDFESRPHADVAAAVYRGPAPMCGGFPNLRFAPLPSAGDEADDVARQWTRKFGKGQGGASAILELTGSAASEAAFKAGAPGHRVLHLATHGFFLNDDCEAAVATEAGPTSSKPARGVPGDNSLRISGLALAGANARGSASATEEDGILTAEEIAALDLRGVEWVVLSACDTGRGPMQQGEGVLGLRRAFEVAGARTLILSLWAVGDHDARAWIRLLYQARLKGLSTIQSVHEATLTTLAERRKAGANTHPFYWGAFVAAGDWR